MTTDMLTETAPSDDVDAPHEVPPGRREYFRSCLKGGLFAAIPFIGLLLMNAVNFMSDSFTTRFYASQARAFLRGEWSIPHAILTFEGFQRGTRWYMYYGPFPALLRLPFVHLIPGAAERMTQSMILLATAIALVCSARITWHVRALVRGERAVTKHERRWVAVFVFVVGAGSAFTFLASQAWVYHEAEAWGAALSIASFDAILSWVRRPNRWSIVAASAFAWASVLSRASVGFGPIAALGLLAVAVAWPRVRNLAGVGVDTARRKAIGLAVAAFVPLASYSYVNYAKFGNLFVFPTAAQEMSQLNPGRKLFLEHSGGSYFALKFVPTTLVQYLRPDALRLSWLLPFIDFLNQPRVFGNVLFDALEPSSSVPSSMPFLFVLSCVAIWCVFRPRRHRTGDGARTLRVPMIGAAVGAMSVLPFGYVAQRYLSDFLPLVVLGGAIGLHIVLRWSDDRAEAPGDDTDEVPAARRRRPSPRAVWSVLGVLAALSVVVNIALATSYHYTSSWAPQEVVGPFVDTQYRIRDVFPGGKAPNVVRGERLPSQPGPRGQLFVVGDCDGIYWSPGHVPELAWGPWQGVARGAKAGEYRFKISFRPNGRRVIEPIVMRGEPGHLQTIAAFVGPGNVVNFAFSSQGHDDLPRSETTQDFFVGQLQHITPGKEYDVTAIMDPYSGHVTVLFDGHVAFRFVQFELTPQQAGSYVFPTDKVAIGKNPYDKTTEPTFSGTLTPKPVPRPSLCKTLGVR